MMFEATTVIFILATAIFLRYRAKGGSVHNENDWVPPIKPVRSQPDTSTYLVEEIALLVRESAYFDETTAPPAIRMYTQSLMKHKDIKHRREVHWQSSLSRTSH